MVALAIAAGTASAQTGNLTPAGKWQALDGDKVRMIVRIEESGGEMIGRIEEVLDKTLPENCNKCTGDLAGKPLKGMRFLYGFRKDGAEWDGGKIVDPSTGNVWSAAMKRSADGKNLELRGYLGIKLIGRTQTWLPAE